MKQRLAQFFIDHPVIGGIAFLVVGSLISREAIKDGTEYARFVGGPQVTGRVAELRGKSSLPANYEMTAKWRDETGRSYSSTLNLFKHEFESLKEGSQVALLLAKEDHAAAIVAAHLEDNKPISIAGVSATPLVFGGIVMAIFGVGLALSALRSKPARRPMTSRTAPRNPRPR